MLCRDRAPVQKRDCFVSGSFASLNLLAMYHYGAWLAMPPSPFLPLPYKTFYPHLFPPPARGRRKEGVIRGEDICLAKSKEDSPPP